MLLEEFVTICKALSDPNRIRILQALRKGELCVCQIIDLLQLAPSTISKHMSVLRAAKLVQSRKDSRWVYFKLMQNPKADIDRFLSISNQVLSNDRQIKQDGKRVQSIRATGVEELCKKQKENRR